MSQRNLLLSDDGLPIVKRNTLAEAHDSRDDEAHESLPVFDRTLLIIQHLNQLLAGQPGQNESLLAYFSRLSCCGMV